MSAPTQPTSGILYRGPSMLDGSPIVCIATYRTRGANSKTGAMVQTYILRDDMSPIDAIRHGLDVSICGTCKHRGDGMTYGSRSCYVNVGQGPTVVYRAYQRGRYAPVDPADMGRGRVVRLGTYGDPAAVPAWVWSGLTDDATGRTGYTHQWQRAAAWDPVERYVMRSLVMASVDTEDEADRARSMGWRTFRVREASEPVQRGEFVCPASAEAGKRRTCIECRACDGNERAGSGRHQASPVIIAHGALAARLAANRERTIPIPQAK